MSGRIPPAVGDFWRLGGAFLMWSASFAVLYALVSFGCALGWDATMVGGFSLQRVVLVAAWAASLFAAGLVLWLATRPKREGLGRHAFVRVTGLALGIVAFAATVANFAPVAVLSTCL